MAFARLQRGGREEGLCRLCAIAGHAIRLCQLHVAVGAGLIESDGADQFALCVRQPCCAAQRHAVQCGNVGILRGDRNAGGVVAQSDIGLPGVQRTCTRDALRRVRARGGKLVAGRGAKWRGLRDRIALEDRQGNGCR
ncbi:MAG: hypothetical protein U5K74_04545 [Gemmatimonadaceae bacterium]|nr:hypothetical protein [Gemmatimonadaceae bacterium]